MGRWRRRAAVVLALPLLGILGLVALRIAYTDRALPGVQLAGTGVEGDSRDALKDRMTRVKVRPVTIYAAGQSLRVTPVDAGYQLDVQATLDRVLDQNRTGPALGIVRTARGLLETHDVRPVDRVDAKKLEATVRSFARLVNRGAYPGGITVDPITLTVDVRGPQRGRTADRPALERALVDALRAGAPRLRAPLIARPVATLADVRAVGRAAEAYLRSPLTLTGAGPDVVLSPEQLAPILRLRASSQDHTKVRLGSDKGRLITLIARLAKTRDHPARSARVSAPGRAVILDGKGAESWRPRTAPGVRVVREARVGRTIDRDAALVAIADAVRLGRHTARIPVRTQQPKVTAQAARAIRSLVGTFTTRFQPGQPRVTNITTMAHTIDGTLIPAGGQFSLNGVVGPRTTAGGYVKAPFIGDGGKIVPSVGGGVSQVSTTTYNAAYFAGLRIDTHQPHSIYIARYPPGREATLDYPGIDLKWTNDTRGPILVRTFVDDHSLTVSLYGHNGGRRVTATPDPRKPFPGGDFMIRVLRTVTYPDGHKTLDSFTTKYDKSQE